ncbi:hypothetical protein [Aureibacter tunicatorum]|uniref:Uncharacterized protein n=1 Tax=Aureibacter tunicatorum TaxID=866807 RepID=A0AAE4BU45_9BACT|nr:hypothetical protein [Aureibacter tunicatorum]MDR6240388.1 hypothetical protein [Aureibacter tunicatorum]
MKFISVLFVVFILHGCIRKVSSCRYDKEMPVTFDFKAEVNFGIYKIDTFTDSLTYKFDWDQDTTISFVIGLDFKKEIYQDLVDIDICKYPHSYAPTTTLYITPHTDYYLEYRFKNDTSIIDWRVHSESNEVNAKRLRKVFEKITKYIGGCDQIKLLPDCQLVFF